MKNRIEFSAGKCPRLVSTIQRSVSRRYKIISTGHYPRTFPPESSAIDVVEIEAALIKQYLLSRSWIDEIILC